MRQVLVPPDQVLQEHVQLVLVLHLLVQPDPVRHVLLLPVVVLLEVSPSISCGASGALQPVPFELPASKSLVQAHQVLLRPDLFDLPASRSLLAFFLLAVSLGIDRPCSDLLA